MWESDIQRQEYPFAQLDEMVEVRLNQLLGQSTQDLSEEDLVEIRAIFIRECARIWTNLKALVFSLLSEEKIKVAIGQHLLVITHLKNEIRENFSGLAADLYPGPDSAFLTGQLDHLESLIRSRYAIYCPDGPPEIRYKVLCALSVDQIGLILKAADDTRLVQARSLNQVFKSIVPYLSTTVKTDISFDSMRASTYHPEAPDKEKAIAALERMIGKIKEYR